MTASGVIWSPELHLANTLKIPTWHQFVSDKWSRPNTVRKVEFKLLQFHSFFSSFSRGGLRFLRIDSPRISNAMGIVHQAIEDAIGDGRIGDLLVPARDRQPGAPWAPERSRRVSRLFRHVEIRSKVVFCAKGVSFSPSLVILSEAKDVCISGWKLGASDETTI